VYFASNGVSDAVNPLCQDLLFSLSLLIINSLVILNALRGKIDLTAAGNIEYKERSSESN